MTAIQEAGALFGRVAVITGGCSGIGRAVAGLYAQHGARIAVNSRSPETAARTADELTAQGHHALPPRGRAASFGGGGDHWRRDVKVGAR